MPDEQQFLDLIGQIYDAATGDEDWTRILGGLSQMLGGHAAVLQRPHAPGQAVQTLVSGIDPDYVGLYGAHYHRLLPIRSWLPRMPGGSVFADRMLVADRDYVRTEFYTDFLTPQDQHASLSWLARNRQGAGATPVLISVWRSRRQPEWGPEQLRLLHRLGPHLEQALEIERRLGASAVHRVAAQLVRSAAELTWRERDCLARIARGASSKEIARQLELSLRTVNEYVESAMRKLEATSRTEAVAKALVLDLLDE
ncbi:helix-turn-helix transcriptional regulator [Inquilinus sp. Marseille-Q2685]|uniref:helix-turn-helix transcriptional regulator n=1 Tax=Inquilinus sp. Marseille-Q2685 TaxID=2866581 RepID=UPI001CE45E49|nr:helix-turn-helix transcriptional regulator [Inquilinus sp. Marseille-Q2685]